jgi:hypothetical protein
MTSDRVAASTALMLLAPVGLAAQAATCTVSGPSVVQGFARDACQKAADVFAFVSPQFAQALSGGGAMLGSANTLGGLGKVSLNLRVMVGCRTSTV